MAQDGGSLPPFGLADPSIGRRHQVFPKLSEAQLARVAIRPGVSCIRFTAGQVLIKVGQENVPFLVIESGAVEVAAPQLDGSEKIIVRHEPLEFTGETNLLSGRRALVEIRAVDSGTAYSLPAEDLQLLVRTDPELSDLILRAFILRRVSLIANSIGDVVLLGSRWNADTLRLKGFLSRTGHPYRCELVAFCLMGKTFY